MAVERRLAELEYAVFDVETTGLIAGRDRMVEIAVCHVDRRGPPRVVMASMIQPDIPISATEIHGLTSADLADAPRFADLANEIGEALAGRIVVGYNVSFDLGFLQDEWLRLGVHHELPHICAMHLRGAIGLDRCRLGEACEAEGVTLRQAHGAATDALATAELFVKLRERLERAGVWTLERLMDAWDYAFCRSLRRPALRVEQLPVLPRRPTRPRTHVLRASTDLAAYQHALMVALADLQITPAEFEALRELREELDLPRDYVRAIHARVFSMYLAMSTNDERLDDREARDIQRLWQGLDCVGWAPGQP